MSSYPTDSWKDKLISAKGNYPTEKQKNIIYKFTPSDIFDHNYKVQQLFEQFYKISPKDYRKAKPKRQPNSFMILRAVLGLVASDKGIKDELGDGIEQSKLAGFIWGGAVKDDKDKFEALCAEFKKFHKELYPEYVYKPTPRNSKVGAVVDIKTADSYQSPSIPSDASVPSNSCQPAGLQDIEIQTSELHQDNFFYGYNPYQFHPSFDQLPQYYTNYYIPIPFQQYNYSTISANCPDPNDSQMTSFVHSNDPYTQSFTIGQNFLPRDKN